MRLLLLLRLLKMLRTPVQVTSSSLTAALPYAVVQSGGAARPLVLLITL